MPQIRPLSDLQDKLNDIYEVIHRTDQPIFFTRDGQNDVVIMSYDTYNRSMNNNNYSHTPTETQSYVRTVVEEVPLPEPEGPSSAEILQEARRKLQDMVDEYSNDCSVSVPKNRKRKRRPQNPNPNPNQ